MPTIYISAFFYSEEEKGIILQYMNPVAETDSFLFGPVEATEIRKLKEQHILVDFQRDPSQPTPPLSQGLGRATPGKKSLQIPIRHIIDVITTEETQYQAIELAGPPLETWKEQLEKHNIELIERVGQNIYRAKVQDASVLDTLNFVHSHRPYHVEDKSLIVQKSIARELDPFALTVKIVGTYDIRLCKNANTGHLISFLKEKGIKILKWSDRKVRALLTSEEEILMLGKRDEVYGIEEYVKPVLHNEFARQLLHIDVDDKEKFINNINLTGEGEIVGVADTGIDHEHPDLADRLLEAKAWGRENDCSDPNGHGTHVAGSIVGNGSASEGRIRGMAPGAKLFFQSVLDADGGIGGLPHDLRELFLEAYNAGVRIHNNSWGSATESEYRFNSLEVDEFIYDHKDMLLVISSGNEGTSFQPRNCNPGFIDWLSLGSPATAKNALTVGASRSARKTGGFSTLTYGQAWPDKYPEEPILNAGISGDPECMAGFSSRGPCGNESRIKPDVVAPGTDIASTRSALAPITNFWGPYPNNRQYAFMGGTSMSAPIVTGFAVLVRQYLRTEKKCASPSAALLKAIIINSTRKLNGADSLADHDYLPNFHQGFGCVDMLNILPSKKSEGLKLNFLDTWQQKDLQFTATGQRFLFRFDLNEGLPLKLCLCWTDPPGRGLQNNLNLLLMHVGRNIRWVGNEQVPRMITAFDRDNNVEIIRIDDPYDGEYRLVVQANNLLVTGQDFALAVTGNIKIELEQIV